MNNINNIKEKAFEILNKVFGYTSFHQGQFEVIENLVKGESTLAIMPTGGGKSICYQIPALMLDGITIVVSPLISLMKDQVDKLKSKNIPVRHINSTISTNEFNNTINLINNNEIKLLYIAPERFNSEFFRMFIKNIKVSLFAIDEAHCISQWGHDFRPSYLRLNNALKLLNHPPIGAFTATATPEVRTDIIKQLDLKSPKIVVKGFDRPNIKYLSLRLKEKQKKEEVLKIINKMNTSTIVYCSTKKSTDKIATFLKDHNIKCSSYHAGIDNNKRTKIQNNFINNKIPVIIATNAFGMGIDKADIKLIIHYNLPGSIEAFYQESGRAGRNGKNAFSLLMGNRQDIAIQKFLINSGFPTESAIKEIYEFLYDSSENPILKTYSEIAANFSYNVNEMMVGNVLKILESHHIIKRLQDKSHPAYINFLIPCDRIYQRNRLFNVRKKILDYFKIIFKDPPLHQNLAFSPDVLLKKTDISREQFTRNIKNLCHTGDIIYISPFSGRGIQKILPRMDTSNLPINFEKLEEKRMRQIEKLECVEEYLLTSICKRSYLLNYFGEVYDKDKCNSCDICLNWRGKTDKIYKSEENLDSNQKSECTSHINYSDEKTSKKNNKELNNDDIKLLYISLLKYTNKIGFNKFMGLLRGSKEAYFVNKGLNKCSFYGKLNHISSRLLKEFILKEKKQGFIKKSKSRLFPKILISDKGKEKVREMLR